MLATALLAGIAVPAAAAVAPLAERVPDVATRFCIDLVSRAVPIPAVGDEERVFARYGLAPGVPNAAMQALGAPGASLLSGATLASGEASDGAFVVALGGNAGETCRIVVYRAPIDGVFVRGTSDGLKTPARGWRDLPSPIQAPNVLRISYLKRGVGNKPFLANLIAPLTPGPVSLIVNVAAVPPNVTMPQGF